MLLPSLSLALSHLVYAMAFTVVLLTSLDHVTYALPDCKRIVRVWYDSELLRPDDDTFLRVSTAAEVVAALDASPTTTTTTVTSSSDKLLSLLLDLVVQSNANEMVVLLPERPIFVSAHELDQARLIRYLSLADARTLLSLQQGSRITRLLDSYVSKHREVSCRVGRVLIHAM